MTRRPTLVLAAHGTRDPEGPPVLDELATAVADAAGVTTRVAYVDVIGPTVADVLAEVAGPVVVVPAFLAAGYHVRADLPRQVDACGRTDVTIAAFLGPDERLLTALVDRLTEAGRRQGDAVVLAAAGSSDARALADVDIVARALPVRVGVPVSVGYVATATPTVPDAVRAARDAGASRVALASWLLAPGLFQQRLADAGADAVAAPLGTHPAVVAALVDRYRGAAVSGGTARPRGA
ncbi:MAG: sirohydrochlorin chelatase [Streptosporangiales bacterium]|nr:sirohydrochlorin chelatase [Streptosporangiales bacterium]MBO0891909.1 sirohydrochlorin chelatase [Acidothermales bacterium]